MFGLSLRLLMLLIPVFMALIAAWALWGWVVGESRNIKWLRNWCAPIFVVTTVLITAGGGGLASRILTKKAIREDVAQMLEHVDALVQQGRSDVVRSEIQKLHEKQLDDNSVDILKELPNLNVRFAEANERRTRFAEKPTAAQQN